MMMMMADGSSAPDEKRSSQTFNEALGYIADIKNHLGSQEEPFVMLLHHLLQLHHHQRQTLLQLDHHLRDLHRRLLHRRDHGCLGHLGLPCLLRRLGRLGRHGRLVLGPLSHFELDHYE